MIKYKQLIKEFKKIPKKNEVLPTYLEICGQPHYENVCSNILSFFFDTKRNHKFKDLVLKSLLDCVDETISNNYDIETKKIHREYIVNENKRIDLVIECNELIITIENKIHHWLANDLNLYEKSIEKHFDNVEKKIYVVLSLKEENIKTSSFKNVTYETFFNKLKQNSGHYFVNANNQYTTFLLDFIKSIENLYHMESINKEYFDFLVKNKDVFDEINAERVKLNYSLQNVVSKVMSVIPPTEGNRNLWLYQKVDIVNDFTFEDGVVALDFVFDLTEVRASLWLRKNKTAKGKYEILDQLQLIKEKPNSFIKTDNKYGYKVFKESINFFEINPDEFAKKIENILNKIKY
ncbi:MAG: hypothetical protein ACI87N_000098 [Flavobacteriales bacterium]|jgi:hypothetical protein